MTIHGQLLKMQTLYHDPIQYELPIDEASVAVNPLIGKYITFRYSGNIYCINCGRKTGKSFFQGFCFPCFRSAPEASECILKPELCEAHNGLARDMEWARDHCLQDHFVYLAVSSGLKVGVTRSAQIPTRWMDQGAWKAVKFARTPNRYLAGMIEVELKQHVADKTAWQRMLKNMVDTDVDLFRERERLGKLLPSGQQTYLTDDGELFEFQYPVTEYPVKVKSVGFDRFPEIAGVLMGIKGQYLIFDDGRVLNIRKHQGYEVELSY